MQPLKKREQFTLKVSKNSYKKILEIKENLKLFSIQDTADLIIQKFKED